MNAENVGLGGLPERVMIAGEAVDTAVVRGQFERALGGAHNDTMDVEDYLGSPVTEARDVAARLIRKISDGLLGSVGVADDDVRGAVFPALVAREMFGVLSNGAGSHFPQAVRAEFDDASRNIFDIAAVGEIAIDGPRAGILRIARAVADEARRVEATFAAGRSVAA
ncbi:MAG: hypothetical protein AAB592_05015 [Patescibacteria group bacterium]